MAFNECKNTPLTDFANQNIWFNKNICFEGKSLFFSSWTKGGLLLVKHLFNENDFKTKMILKDAWHQQIMFYVSTL